MLLPPDVVPEDIISIQGQHVALESKKVIASVNSSEFLPQELEKQWIDLRQQGDVLFLDSWEVKDKEKENKVFAYFVCLFGFHISMISVSIECRLIQYFRVDHTKVYNYAVAEALCPNKSLCI